MTAPFRCDDHDARIAKLESARGFRWIPVLVAAVTALGVVGAAAVPAHFALKQTREQMRAQPAEAMRQEVVKLVLEVSEQKRQEAYEQGRRDGRTEGRSEALAEALAASKREGVASKARRR
jgi:hypothetical protein